MPKKIVPKYPPSTKLTKADQDASQQGNNKAKPRPITLEDLGLTAEEMKVFTDGSRFLFGTDG